MGETLKLSVRLLAFALIAAVLLAGTHEITKGPIAEQAVRQANVSRELVLPGVDEFAPIEIKEPDQYPAIDAVHEVKKGGAVQGYTFLVHVQGYKGPIVLTLAVNASGSINALTINSQTETAGLGNKISGEPFLNQFPGAAADPDKIAGDIDAISGATVSSNAVIGGVEQALRYAQTVLGIAPKAGEVVTEASVNKYQAIEARTGAGNVKELTAYEAAGYPSLRHVYSCVYEGQPGYLFEFDGKSVILSDDGAPLGPSAADGAQALREAQRYLDQFLRNGVSAG